MILQALNDLYTRLASDPDYDISPPGFSPQKISFRVVLRPDGTVAAIEDARVKNAKGLLESVPMEVPAAEKRTSGIKAQFLWDKPEYLLGQQQEGKREGFAHECFESFKARHLACEKEVGSSAFSTVCRFLETWTPGAAKDDPILKDAGGGFGVFQILGEKRCVHEDVVIRNWWATKHDTGEDQATEGQCLVSGARARICRIHPDIKGFKSSVALVGIQENTPYESYLKSKAENCPISQEVAFRYSTALNWLLTGPEKDKHRIMIAGTTVVFWTESKLIQNCFASIIGLGSDVEQITEDTEQRSRVQRVLVAIKSGARMDEFGDPPDTPFFIFGLEQPNPGRFSVRFFLRSTVDELIQKLHQYYEELELEGVPEYERFPPFWKLLSLSHRRGGDPLPLFSGAITRSIITGNRFPGALLPLLVGRCLIPERDPKTDKQLNPTPPLRIAFIKAILNRNFDMNMTSALDPNHPDVAYHLGRLFAVYEQSQRQAHDFKLDRTIRETLYASACATPAATFRRLDQLNKHHLRKLKPGSQKFYSDLIAEIIQNVRSSERDPAHLPRTLSNQDQAVYLIGYYHQMHELKNRPSKEIEEKQTTETTHN
jgi:CRISPR-associated protein Csd1